MKIRTFIAIPVSTATHQYFTTLQNSLRPLSLEIKWVDPLQTHLTMQFLGSISPSLHPTINTIVKKVVQSLCPFEISLTHFGFFPNKKNPRIFYIATNQEHLLRKIALALENDLSKLNFSRNNTFTPHITLGRFKGKKNITLLLDMLSDITINHSFPVNSIVVFTSILTPQGPHYEAIGTHRIMS